MSAFSEQKSDQVFDFRVMKDGSTLLKVSRNAAKASEKTFKISQDLRYIVWVSDLFSFHLGKLNKGECYEFL